MEKYNGYKLNLIWIKFEDFTDTPPTPNYF